jgi:hypothetical protein
MDYEKSGMLASEQSTQTSTFTPSAVWRSVIILASGVSMIGAVAVLMATFANIAPLTDRNGLLYVGKDNVAIVMTNSALILLHQVIGRCSSACTMQVRAITDSTGRMIFVHLDVDRSTNMVHRQKTRNCLLASLEWFLFSVEVIGQLSLL